MRQQHDRHTLPGAWPRSPDQAGPAEMRPTGRQPRTHTQMHTSFLCAFIQTTGTSRMGARPEHSYTWLKRAGQAAGPGLSLSRRVHADRSLLSNLSWSYTSATTFLPANQRPFRAWMAL